MSVRVTCLISGEYLTVATDKIHSLPNINDISSIWLWTSHTMGRLKCQRFSIPWRCQFYEEDTFRPVGVYKQSSWWNGLVQWRKASEFCNGPPSNLTINSASLSQTSTKSYSWKKKLDFEPWARYPTKSFLCRLFYTKSICVRRFKCSYH